MDVIMTAGIGVGFSGLPRVEFVKVAEEPWLMARYTLRPD
jgi:hypothetical protein